jgi:inorganic triphosphatase YgiF
MNGFQPMKPHTDPAKPQEVELKLYLPSADPASLAQQLAHTSPLRRHKATQQQLHNIYYDTPDQQLRQQRAVLRLRRVGDAVQPQWLQTFKTGAADSSALSRRGEWECPVVTPELSRLALQHSAWVELDPDGSLFATLEPCFVTVFERSTWLVPWPDASVVEVALDLGYIEANGRRAPICELELELKAGQPSALFELARELARSVAVMPANISKAQRGFLLAQDGLNQPHHSSLPALPAGLPMALLAQQLLRHMFAQFTNNLDSLRVSDDPEVLHQARVGWRRFKSGLRLFKKVLSASAPPVLDDLRILLSGLGELRNMDVARTQTLPALASAYAMGDARRAQSWQALIQTLTQAADVQRQAVRQALQIPSVGASLLAWSHWLETLPTGASKALAHKASLRHWVTRRMLRLNQQLALTQQVANTPEQWHRVRILAKRLRYSSEALQDWLPHRLAKQVQRQAAAIQNSIGAARDMAQASELVAHLEVERGMVEFLRGVAVGAAPPWS